MCRTQQLLLTALIIGLTAASRRQRHRQSSDYQDVLYTHLEFVSDLCRLVDELDYQYLPTNLFFSPLSLHILLAALSLGASGETYDQLKSFVAPQLTKETMMNGFKEMIEIVRSNMNTTVLFGKALFLDKSINVNLDYSNVVKHYFHTAVLPLNFNDAVESKSFINDWASFKTNGKITNAANEFTPDSGILLENVAYVKGKWRYPFEAKRTFKQDFYAIDGIAQKVDFMEREDRFRFMESDDLLSTLLELEYEGPDLRMIIILPRRSVPISAVEGLLFLQKPSFNIPDPGSRVRVLLPKFKLQTKTNLVETLSMSGVKDLFQNNANFSRLTTYNIKVSHVVQNALLEVSEEGTEDAVDTGRMSPASRSIVVNHPFLFVIEHIRTKIPLFIGRVTKIPTNEISKLLIHFS